MYFVGRKKELRRIERTLAEEKSIIIQGKFGMGRTALVRRAAELHQGRREFWFADFSQPPEKMCRRLYAERFPTRRQEEPVRYKTMRRRLVDAARTAPTKVVLVLDNIDSITPAKVELAHYFFLSGAFLFIAVADLSLTAEELVRLRAALNLFQKIFLSNLSRRETEAYFRYYAARYQWNWSDELITARSRLTRGYPLLMAAAVSEMLERSQCQATEGVMSHDQDQTGSRLRNS